MAIVCQPEDSAHCDTGCGNFIPAHPGESLVLQTVETGQILFQTGDQRTLYRIERGALCHYVLWSDGRHELIEFAFPGDIVGLGQLRRHVSTAQAMVDTVVSIVTDEEFEAAIACEDRLSFRLASAVEREFDYLRDRALATESVTAAARVANFLLALSSMNGPEGREPDLISDEITAGFVADKLHMSVEKLGTALLHLKKEGAVRETPSGLRIIDVHTLRRLADAA